MHRTVNAASSEFGGSNPSLPTFNGNVTFCNFRVFISMPSKEYIREYREKRKKEAIRYLGGKCKKCNSKKNLEFDHIDPTTKKNQISSMFTSSIVQFYEELNKCQLLCRRCHLRKSSENGDYTRNRKAWQHGVSGYINQKCRCEICILQYKIYRKNRWRKSKT